MDESDKDLNQLLTTGGDMQNKLANPILLMSAPDSVNIDYESGANTANVTLVMSEASPVKEISPVKETSPAKEIIPAKQIKDEKPIKDKK